MTKCSRKRQRPVKVGTQIICQAMKKMSNKLIKKINNKKKEESLKSKNIQQEDKVNSWCQENIIPLDQIAFDFQLKNKCHKTIDLILLKNYESASVSHQIEQPFQNINEKNTKSINQNGEDLNLYNNNNTYLTYLHQVNNTSNSSNSFAFVSSTILPDLKEMELFLREELQDSQSNVKSFYFTVSYLCPVELSYQDLLEIYNFNIGFFKDFLQDSNNIQQIDFNDFLESKSTLKFLLVLLNEKYSKVNAKSFFSQEFQDLSKQMNSEDNTSRLSQNPDLIDFPLIQTFNNQKKKELLDNSYLLTLIFKKYKSDLEMEEENQINNIHQKESTIVKSQDNFKEIQVEIFNKESLNQQTQQIVQEQIQSKELQFIEQPSKMSNEIEIQQKPTNENNELKESEKQLQNQQNSLQTNKKKEELSRKCFDGDGYHETELLQKIPEILGNNQFQKTIKSNMFRHAFFIQDFYQIVEVFDICNTTISQFIQSYSKNTNMSYEKVLYKLFLRKGVTKEDLERDSLYDIIYKYPNKYLTNSTQLFFLIRKHFQYSQENSKSESTTEINKDSNQPINQYVLTQKQMNYQMNCPIFNRKNPLVLCKKAHHLKNFDYLNEHHIKNNKFAFQTCVDRNFSDSKLNLFLFPLEHMYMSVLPTPTIDSLLLSSSIFSLIKDIMVVKSFSENFNLQDKVNFELLLESFSFSSYSKTKNLELLEVIGDVVIKYISSLYLIHHLPCSTENVLTILRSYYINNKYLGISSFYNGLHFYTFTKKPNSYDWRFNLFNQSSFDDVSTENFKQINVLNYSNLSDILESVMGTIFVSNNFTLQSCLQFSKKLGLKIEKNLESQCSNQVQGSFMIQNEYLDQLEINEDMSYQELYSLKPKQNINQHSNQTNFTEEENKLFIPENLYDNLLEEKIKKSNEGERNIFMWNLIYFYIQNEIYFENQYKVEYINNTDYNQRRRDRADYRKFKQLHDQTLDCVLQNFERNINYTFKDKTLLIKALNCRQNPQFAIYSQDYQILEYLGDALIEILIVSNGYNITRNKNNQIKTPYFFCELKSLLLSNDFISRLAVLNKYHCYALNIHKHQQDEIIQFIQSCDFNTKFKESVIHQANSPKILGDLWESVAGAIVMDSDINTFVQIYGSLYAPFVYHFSIYYDKIIYNVKEKVQLVAQQTYSQLVKETEVIEEVEGVNKVKIDILINKIKVGSAIDSLESLAEKKAYQDAYENIFIKKITNLGLVFQGKNV